MFSHYSDSCRTGTTRENKLAKGTGKSPLLTRENKLAKGTGKSAMYWNFKCAMYWNFKCLE